MKLFIYNSLIVILLLIVSTVAIAAPCTTGAAPSYSSGCTDQYFTSVTASGTGVVSTISYSGSSCVGSYYNLFSTQGIIAPTGTTVNINVSRASVYYAYLAVYVDWNNNGTYETSELVGTVVTIPVGMAAAVYSFTIPLTGITTNTNLNMRVFLGEPASAGGPLSSINPPCSAKWGQSNDYYIKATCTDPTISVTPASPTVCGSTGTTGLTASGAGTSPTYEWSPATGLSATTGASVTATPGTTTTYTVTGYGPGVCPAMENVTVSVSPGFTAVITPGSTTTFCPGGSVSLAETSGVGVGYQWYAGATAIPGATTATYTASPAATTTYSVNVTDAIGCSAAATETVTILAVPIATVTPAGPVTVCDPATVALSASTGAGYTYRWFSGSSVIGGAVAIAYTATVSGTYRAEVTAPTGCRDTSAGVSVTINPSPVAIAFASGALEFCFGDSVVLTGIGSGLAYQWLDGGATIAGATNITYTATALGAHDYQLRVTNGLGCSDVTAAGTFPVVVDPIPVSAITASGPLSFCTGGSVTLSVPAVAGYTYQWSSGASIGTATPIAGATSSALTAGTTAYYLVHVVSPEGCSSTTASPAEVTLVDIPSISYGTPLKFCWGSHVHLSVGISSTAPGVSFQWQRNGANITGAASNNYDAFLDGTYTCVITVAGSCTGTTAGVTVTTVPLPDPVITYTGGYLTTSPAYVSYQWYYNLIPIPGATTYRYMPAVAGDYSLIVTDVTGCVSKTTHYPLGAVGVGVQEVSGNELPRVFPSPVTDMLYVANGKAVHVVVASPEGRVLVNLPGTKQVDMSLLADGLYIVKLFDEAGNSLLTTKVVKH